MQRLRSRQQFQAVMAGPPVARTPHFALHRAALSCEQGGRALFPVADAWLGVLLPKRWARRAVTRNAIRRQIYEVARHRADSLPQAALVVRLRSTFNREQFVSATSVVLKRAVRAELEQLLGRVAVRPVAASNEAETGDAAV
ncbi:ribonuclease P protein component [Hydrogenophaga sp.]|uniref:ribonuclease P protein component n=1 Tax=Hydrogenophaga sp. TaxID=1904254 RepID=UPI00262BFC19|nr:ribonuclease P protein component [Hydrogenophaga sp.]MCW5654796.1 ribonuclease P protein component [Hydrogenophaga sp.]